MATKGGSTKSGPKRDIYLAITIVVFIIILVVAIYIFSSTKKSLDSVDQNADSVNSVLRGYCSTISRPSSILTIPQSALDRCRAAGLL